MKFTLEGIHRTFTAKELFALMHIPNCNTRLFGDIECWECLSRTPLYMYLQDGIIYHNAKCSHFPEQQEAMNKEKVK